MYSIADSNAYRPSEWTISGELSNVADVATRTAARRNLIHMSNENERPLPPLPKSFSTPMLVQDEPKAPMRLRRSRSECGLRETAVAETSRDTFESNDMLSKPANALSTTTVGTIESEVPALHVQEPTNIGEAEPLNRHDEDVGSYASTKCEDSAPSVGMHLHKMEISHQLRSMSQLSDVAEDDIKLPSPHPWNFHYRERSDFEANPGRGRHARQKSSSGIDSSTLPSIWGRVRTPIRDATSSIYSRPTSAGANALEQETRVPSATLYGSSNGLNTLFAAWPLKPSPSAEETRRALKPVSERSAGSQKRNKPLPPTPGVSRKQCGAESFVTAANHDEDSLVKWVSPPQRACSIRSSSSSSTLTKVTKRSSFLERFSPPKKLVRKRRSIFKFLRPGSRKQEGRSISTPVMSTKSPKRVGVYDGPSDDPALLTVQYELVKQPSNRSVSMSHVGSNFRTDVVGELSTPHTLERSPTLAEYERNLSVIGDDRRRPSAVNFQRMKEIQEEDRRESVGLRRRLSRARALKDDASPLMAQALEKHQQEKALFRSASKQRESLESAYPIPVSKSSPFTGAEVAPSSSTSGEQNEFAEARATGRFTGSSGQSLSVTHLALPDLSTTASSRRGSIAGSTRAASAKASSKERPLPVSVPHKNRIGTSLDRWSRYPSHTRSERCGSAGRPDAVLTRDFAVDINPHELNVTDETDPASPESKQSGKSASKHSKKSMPKRHSTTFNNILRYYSNLFHTSGFSGQNRRTSVTTAGRLEYPELEMLPPQLPSELSSHHRHSHPDRLDRLVEHMKEDADKIKEYVREEEDKFEDYVRKEEDKIEEFVRKEEDLLEGFVKKEEAKLKTYVKEEEDKLTHHHRHRSNDHDFINKDNPFLEVGGFGFSHDHAHGKNNRSDTVIGPTEHVGAGSLRVRRDGSTDDRLTFDGTAEKETMQEVTVPKAKLWSDVYKECLTKPSSAGLESAVSEQDNEKNTMPPPPLRPAKARSPEHSKPFGPKATIRRFPSVTVIDDRKGHFRSVSLISVKTSRSTGFERSSTHDLLELIQTREREEREKLLEAVGITKVAQVDG